MAKYITEVLKEINDNVDLFNSTYKKQGDGGILGTFFTHAYNPAAKFLLPQGAPPYKPAPQPLGMTTSNMVQEIKRFYVLCRPDLRPIKREQIFIEMLENVHPDEAKILLAVKDQSLTQLYPKITHKVLADAGFIPASAIPVTPTAHLAPTIMPSPELVAPQPEKKKRGRPPKAKPSEDH